MGRVLESSKPSVAQIYVQYSWLETGATPLEEKIFDYSVLCIRQDPKKGYREFKELPDPKKFLKRLVDQVYSKDPQNVGKILTIVDLINDLEQKLIIIWALFDQIILNDDTNGAKNCLEKLREIKVLIDGNGNFSECDLWQIKLMDHQLNRLQHMAEYSPNCAEQAGVQRNLTPNSDDMMMFIGEKLADNTNNLKTYIDDKLGRYMSEMKEVFKAPVSQSPTEKLLGKPFQIFGSDRFFFILRTNKGDTCGALHKDQILFGESVQQSRESYISSGDIWILEKFPNQNEQTFYLKNLTFGGYLRATSETILSSQDQLKVKLEKEKMAVNGFAWKLCHHENNVFYINICNYSGQKYHLSVCPMFSSVGKVFLCISSKIQPSKWSIVVCGNK